MNNIRIIGNEIALNAAKVNAKGGDISLITTKDNLFIGGVSAKFDNYQSHKRDGELKAKLDNLDKNINEIKNKHSNESSQKITLLEKEKRLTKDSLSMLSQHARGHEYVLSDLKGKNINLISTQGINIEGSKLTAEQKANIYASGTLPNKEEQIRASVNINGVFDTYEYGGGDHYSYAIFNNPTIINAKNGIHIVATENKNGNIVIGASQFSAPNDKIYVQAYGDIITLAGQGEIYTYNKYTYKSGGWLHRRYHTDIHEDRHAKAEPTRLSAKRGIDLIAGGNIDAYATVFDAPKGTINLTAGKALRLYAVDEISYSKLEKHKKSRFIGISYHRSHDSNTVLMKSALPSRLVAQSTNLKSGWDTVLQGTQFANTLTGAHIQAGVGEKARKDAKILLQGMKSLIQTEEHHKSSSMVWQSMSGKGEVIENLMLPIFKGKQPVFHAAGGIVVDIPKGKLKDEIVKLLAKPEYAYLKDLQTNEKINWNEVALAYDKWDYKQQGLTGAGAALIAIVVAVATYGAGSALAGTIAGTSLSAGSASAAMANAAFSSLASQASIAVINNRGNMSEALKDLGHSSTVKQLATSVVTAGVANQIISSMRLSNVTESSLLTDRLQVSLINAGTSAVVNTAINGGKLDKALENAIVAALAETLQGEAAQYIKGIKEGANANTWYHEVAHKLAHAAVGCAAASASKGKCQDGAMGAALGEVVAEILGKQIYGVDNSKQLNPDQKRIVLNTTRIIVGSIAALTHADVYKTVDTATVTIQNNYLADWQEIQKNRELANCNDYLCRIKTEVRWAAIGTGQNLSFAAGMVVGAPEFLQGELKNIIEVASSPIETLKAIKVMLQQDNALKQIAANIKQGYINRIDSLTANLEKAGAEGAYNAGREAARLLGDIVLTIVPVTGATTTGVRMVGKGMAVAGKTITHQVNRVTNFTVLNKVIKEVDNIAVSTNNGFINATKVCNAACEIKPTNTLEKKLLDDIIKNGDPKGAKTEQLINDLAQRSGYVPLQGGKYGSNNGFDHVLGANDKTVVIIDSKPLRNGTLQMSTDGASINGQTTNQLSENWINAVIRNLPKDDPSKLAILDAIKEKKPVVTLVAGVDKANNKVFLVPVKIPNK